MVYNVNATININPKPQELKVLGEEFFLTEKVNVVDENTGDKDAVRVLHEILYKNNIRINTEYDINSTTIILGENSYLNHKDLLKNINLSLEFSKNKEQGYILISSKEDNLIIIDGYDNVGTFYGVQTFRQLMREVKNGVLLTQCIIRDYPTIKSRGVIEGFYGKPWTQDERVDHLHFYGENKLNMYIYAPKSDPYHREKWREPYPQNELTRMKNLINESRKNKVDFVFAISPGIDIKFNGKEGEEDYRHLLNKCESLYEMGVRSFAIFWDDIEDKSGEKQAEVLNKFNRDFIKVKRDVTPLLTVPTEYCSNGMIKDGEILEYTKSFSTTLDTDIEVFWTGIEVVPEGITLDDAKLVRNVYGKRLSVWWNYPVSDYYENKLALGPICELSRHLGEEIEIFTMNPMRFAETSKIALYTGANYGWNPKNYNYNESWNNAITSMYGETAEYFKCFANHSTRMDAGWAKCGREDAPEIKVLIDELWDKVDNNKDIALDIDILYKEFNQIVNSSNKLKDLLNERVMSECEAYINRFELLGNCAKLALDIVVVLTNNDKVSWEKLNKVLSSEIEKIKIGPKMSEKILINFINEVNKRAYLVFDSKVNESKNIVSYKATTDMIPKEICEEPLESYEMENIIISDLNKGFVSNNNIQKGNYIKLDLGEVIEVKSILLLQGEKTMIGKLQYSTNEANWIDICNENKDSLCELKELDIKARYIKYTAVENLDFKCYVKEFIINKTY